MLRQWNKLSYFIKFKVGFTIISERAAMSLTVVVNLKDNRKSFHLIATSEKDKNVGTI